MYQLKQVPQDFIVKEQTNIRAEKTGEFIYFWLTKRNYTTHRACEQLAKQFRIPLKWIGFAGNKDKDAVTTQLISLKHVAREKAEKLSLTDLDLRFYGKGSKPISLGDLQGNTFQITIRNIEKKPLARKHFPNYFDMQRFSEQNPAIGKLLLQKKFSDAVALINDEHILEMKQQHPNDPIAVLRALPRKIWMLYINSYQSLLWNRMVALYLQKFKHKTVTFPVGDLVFPTEQVKNAKIPLLGFGTEWQNAKIGKIGEELLKQEGITLRDFIVREFPELSSEGGERDLMVTPTGVKMGKLEEDELNAGKKKVTMTFTLPKGSYATMYMRSIFA